MYAVENSVGSVTFVSPTHRLRLVFVTPAIVRVSFTQAPAFTDAPSLIVTARTTFPHFTFAEDESGWTLATPALTVHVDRHTAALRYSDASGKLLLREPARGGKSLTPKPLYRNVFSPETSTFLEAQSIDGARSSATNYESVFDRNAFEATLELVFAPEEALFGLGSHEEGYANLRGRSRELYQQNMKAVVPTLVSTRGYGILFDCASLMTFRDEPGGATWWADAIDQLDVYFFHGPTYDDLLRAYRDLTGPTPLPPKWLFGYLQSKERYVNAEEMLAVVHEYRRRRIPLDCIVLDWKSWPNGSGWGQKSFDPLRFPDPAAFTHALHQSGARLMVSIWPIMTGHCPDQVELQGQHAMLGNQSTYNAFLPHARATYWAQANRGLFTQGVDAWWCDCTEPFEADWTGAVKPEPQARLLLNTAQLKLYLDPTQINAYSLLHSQGIYEGQRAGGSPKRVVNLTRSSYAGQHRYGTITWNGDISATWETLRRCIPEGLNFCATGEPYWTTDIGGFFLNHDPSLWFWRGDFPAGTRGLTPADALHPDPHDTGSTDLGFHELYTRWLQYAVFLPVFRSHGTDAPREIWRFGNPGNRFYDTIAAFIHLRYRLLPYIYSLAALVTSHGTAMMRAVALSFPEDPATHHLDDQYLFGPSLLVCPVTSPMYFAPASTPLHGIPETREVYLPAGHLWFDFWTGIPHPGGQTLTAAAPLERIPLYLRAGSILPMTESMQFTSEIPDAPYEIRVYCGADATFPLYEDAGDTYACEQGQSAVVTITWHDRTSTLTLSARHGNFPELIHHRLYRITFLSTTPPEHHTISYSGQAVTITRGHRTHAH